MKPRARDSPLEKFLSQRIPGMHTMQDLKSWRIVDTFTSKIKEIYITATLYKTREKREQ